MSGINEAARDNDLPHLKRLIEQKANIEPKDWRGTPLIVGSKKWSFGGRHVKANIEARDSNGNTSLIEGAGNGHLEIVKYLVGVNANIEAKGLFGDTVLRSRFRPYRSDITNVIKQKIIENRIRVFARDMTHLQMLNKELERALGAPLEKQMRKVPKNEV